MDQTPANLTDDSLQRVCESVGLILSTIVPPIVPPSADLLFTVLVADDGLNVESLKIAVAHTKKLHKNNVANNVAHMTVAAFLALCLQFNEDIEMLTNTDGCHTPVFSAGRFVLDTGKSCLTTNSRGEPPSCWPTC